jgi:DNA invertase Pin-like site-specific DNA recombinase
MKPTSIRSNFAQMGRKLPEEILRDLLIDVSNNLPYKTIAKRRHTTRMTVKRIAASHDIVQELTSIPEHRKISEVLQP